VRQGIGLVVGNIKDFLLSNMLVKADNDLAG
jgi:hypothetical protein